MPAVRKRIHARRAASAAASAAGAAGAAAIGASSSAPMSGASGAAASSTTALPKLGGIHELSQPKPSATRAVTIQIVATATIA